MEFSEKIYKLRKKQNLTLEQVGNFVGVGKSTVRKWERGIIANMKRDKIAKLAQCYRVPPSYLLGWDETSNSDLYFYDNITPLPETELIPLVGTIACGTPTLAEENIEEFIKVDKSIKATFALQCKGDSMINARIFDGDIVYIRQQDDIENGEIAAVLIGEEATLKKVYKYPNRLELRAENPTFPTLNFEGESLQEIRILGKAVAFLSLIR